VTDVAIAEVTVAAVPKTRACAAVGRPRTTHRPTRWRRSRQCTALTPCRP
jgi:hypothetical protein